MKNQCGASVERCGAVWSECFSCQHLHDAIECNSIPPYYAVAEIISANKSIIPSNRYE